MEYKPTFIMAIWLHWSGKSSAYERGYSIIWWRDLMYVSSDNLREEMFWDVNDQTHNWEVFDRMKNDTIKYLKEKKSVYYDATNLNAKKRIALLKEIKSKVNINANCIFFATPYDVCLEQNKKRDRVVPEHVIKRMYKTLEIPHESEWRDQIDIDRKSWYNMEKLLQDLSLCNISHDNSHHSLSVLDHMIMAFKCVPSYLSSVALFHDIWKPFCKVFTNAKWEPTDEAHYYWHESVWAYMYLCAGGDLYGANLIQHHMDYFKWEWYIEKIKERFWNQFSIDLDCLHQADHDAHYLLIRN